MKLLVVMAHNPFNPKTGSENLAFNNIIKLSENNYIDVLTLDLSDKQIDIDCINCNIILADKNKDVITKWLKILLDGLKISFSFTIFISIEMRRQVGKLLKHRTYDAILLYELGAVQYFQKSNYNKIILNIEDPLSLKLMRMANLSVWTKWDRLKLIVRSKIESLYEKHIFPKMAKVLVLSAADLNDMYKEGVHGKFGCVSYGTKQMNATNLVPYEKRTDGMIVFSGNMFHPPNIDGALFFLHQIYPLVLREYPSANLWIVGANPDKRILYSASQFNDHVVITGRVTEVSEYVKVAKVSICPIRLKIGVQTKILEALSCGTPVVTTSAGNSGICGVNGRDLWIEDAPSKFASRVISLLRGESWSRFSTEGRKFVAEHFTWERSASELEMHIKQLSVNQEY